MTKSSGKGNAKIDELGGRVDSLISKLERLNKIDSTADIHIDDHDSDETLERLNK